MPDRINQAIQLIKRGNKREAFSILKDIAQHEPRNEMAWLLLSVCVDDLSQKRLFLQKVLDINPNNPNALAEIQKIPPQVSPTLEPVSKSIGTNQQKSILEQTQSQKQVLNTIQQPSSTSQQINCPNCQGYKIENTILVDKRTGKEVKGRFGCLATIFLILATSACGSIIKLFTESIGRGIDLTDAPVWFKTTLLIIKTSGYLCAIFPFLYVLYLDIRRRRNFKAAIKVKQYTCEICGMVWREDGLPVKLK